MRDKNQIWDGKGIRLQNVVIEKEVGEICRVSTDGLCIGTCHQLIKSFNADVFKW